MRSGIKYIFCPLPQGLKPQIRALRSLSLRDLFMKKIKRFFFEIRSTRKKGVREVKPLNLFMGFHECPLPSS